MTIMRGRTGPRRPAGRGGPPHRLVIVPIPNRCPAMTTRPTPSKTLTLAVRAAREAGAILLRSYRRIEAREKAPGDLVTDADLASQRHVAELFAREFPESTLLAEEEGVVPDPQAQWCWVVDPLDGTVNYAHGLIPWCVSIGLVHRDQIVVGVIYDPVSDTVFSAERGRGAFENGQPMRVSSAEALRDSLIATGLPTNPTDLDRLMHWFARFSQGTHAVRRSGSTAWNLAMLARGSFEVKFASGIKPWDVAAGILLVEEAGGRITDLEGRPYQLGQPGILATNGRLHQQALDVLVSSA